MPYPIIQKEFTTKDGTRIGYQIAGKGKEDFILCNGLGGTMIAWSPIYNTLGDRYRFITWDYRGLFTSGAPQDKATLTIPHHARDLEELMQREKIKSAHFGGWSMGVQVMLEFYRFGENRIRSLFAINGTYGNPFHTALNSPLSKFVLPLLNDLMKKVMPKIQQHIKPLAKTVVDKTEFTKILSALGLTHERIQSDIIKQIVADMMETDLALYHEILTHLAEHDASDILPHVRVPTLVIAGTNDAMTPSTVAETMAQRIPHAELMIINNGSHYTMLEFPDIVVKRLSQFLREHKG